MLTYRLGEVIFALYIFLRFFKVGYGLSIESRDSDICSHWNGRRHFLELGDRGELHAYNVSSSYARSYVYTNVKNNTVVWYQCNLELVTCSECVIRITFTYANFSKSCDRPNASLGNPSSRCPCDHIQFSEPPYDTDVSGQYFCGEGKVYRSQTRALLLKFFYRSIQPHIFSLQYFSERNVKIISGTPRQSIVSNTTKIFPQVITTPYFPVPYPRDYAIEHILSCDSDNCHVRLDFTDFQLGLTSTMEVFDSNGQMLDTYTGENFRPPIIVSTGKSLLLQFRGNGVTGLGYRAEVTFISEKQLKEKEIIPLTDCGGVVGSFGGAITMMNMIENSTEVRYYDCIWLIKPGSNYMLMKTHILLRVDSFHSMASRSQLTIRQGTTSVGTEIETVRWPSNNSKKKNHVVPIMTGYYVRLRGVFGVSSRLAIVYSVFNYMNCYIGSEFLCQNNHCISVRLHCDGFDHCGDGSDEPEKCDEDWAHIPNDRRWYSHKPNYYFPKVEQYPDLKTATGIFIVSTLGILLVISGWMVILYRMGVRARNQRELHSHLQTISELLDRQEELPSDQPPDYEAPPDYEEVIKVGMDDEMRTPCKRHRRNARRNRSGQPGSRSRSREGRNSPFLMDPNTPSCSNQAQREQLQDFANNVLVTTTYCEIAEKNSASAKRFSWRDKGCQTGSMSDDSGKENNDRPGINYKENSCYSFGTSTQYEERSSEFRDESLNVSLTLSMPKSSLTENNPLRPKTIPNFENNNCLKKTWLIFSNNDFSKNENRSRQLENSETYVNNEMNYGSYLQSDRNSFISNASTFGSDLPSDHSPGQDFAHRNLCPSQFENQLCLSPSGLHSGYESDCNDNRSATDISCFGHVNIFSGGNKRQKNYVRSKSFNQNDHRNEIRTTGLKRSSSADLLLLNPYR